MTLLISGLYLADIVNGLNFVLVIVLLILGLLAFIFIILLLNDLYDDDFEYTNKIFKRYHKKYFFILIFSILTFVLFLAKIPYILLLDL